VALTCGPAVSAKETKRRRDRGRPRASWTCDVLMRPRACDVGPTATAQDGHRVAVQCGRGRQGWVRPVRAAARLLELKAEKEGGLLFFLKQILNWILNSLLNLNQPLNTKNPMQQHECTFM
jgi:hypothetical protein